MFLGTPTLSSGHTAQLAEAARRCDQQRLLQSLRVGSGNCCAGAPNPKSAIYSSILTQERAAVCQPSPVEQSLQFPRAGTTESIRLQKTLDRTLTCDDRYSQYRRFVPVAPCPPPTAEQLNSTTPKPTYRPGCTPSRFY